MKSLRRTILHALDNIGDDEIVLGILLMMREADVAQGLNRYANAHPAIQQMVLSSVPVTRCMSGQIANENAVSKLEG